MKKHFTPRKSNLIFAVLLFGLSASVVAAPHEMASWGGGEKKSGHESHGEMKSGGGDWKSKKGSSSLGMGGEGFMTARLRAVWSFNLTKDQKMKIRAIQRDLRAKHWALEDSIEVTADKLFDLYNSGNRDAKAIGKVYGEIFDFRRQIIEIAIDAGNKVEAELTMEQLSSLKKWRPKHKWGGGWSGMGK